MNSELMLDLDSKKKVIYLGVPYTHPDPDVMAKRVAQAEALTALLIEKGFIVYSPVPYSVPYAQLGVEPPEGWYTYQLYLLRNCDVLWAVRFAGWQQSEGLRLEIKFARLHGIPIVHVDPSDYFKVKCINV